MPRLHGALSAWLRHLFLRKVKRPRSTISLMSHVHIHNPHYQCTRQPLASCVRARARTHTHTRPNIIWPPHFKETCSVFSQTRPVRQAGISTQHSSLLTMSSVRQAPHSQPNTRFTWNIPGNDRWNQCFWPANARAILQYMMPLLNTGDSFPGGSSGGNLRPQACFLHSLITHPPTASYYVT